MMRRAVHLLLSVTLLWFANANLWSGAWSSASGDARGRSNGALTDALRGAEREPLAHSVRTIESHDEESRIAINAPALEATRWALLGPALPSANVAVPTLHTAPVAVRDAARTAVPISAASLHARRARHLASLRAASTVHRLDALWRADAQRLLAIPQYAIAPPLIG